MNEILKFLSRRRHAYVALFNSPYGKVVLEDLAAFCRARESVFHPDSRVTDVMIGRREVWDRIRDHLNLSDEELYSLATGAPAQARQSKQVEADDEDFS